MSRKRQAMTPDQRAAKQARDRAYRARQVAQAKAAGLPSAVAYGHGRRVGAPPVAELRASGALPSRPPRRAPRVLRRTVVGDTVAVRTGNKAEAERVLRDAAEAGQTVTITGTFKTRSGFRRVTLNGRSADQRDFIGTRAQNPTADDGIDGSAAPADYAQGGGGAGGGQSGGGRSRLGRMDTPTSRGGRTTGAVVEIRTGGPGADAADVYAAWIDYDGDWWDFLADWADSEY